MENLFNQTDQDALLTRVRTIEAGATRQWGRMTLPQALAHLAATLDYPLGVRQTGQTFLGRVVTPLIRRSVLGPKPFGQGAPTTPDLVVADDRDLETERQRLREAVLRFCAEGRGGVNNRVHPFFGALPGDAWGRLMYKHIDHHLRQFGG